MKNIGSNAHPEALQDILYGNPTHDSLDFGALMQTVTDADDGMYKYWAITNNPNVVQFAAKWHAGINRNGVLGIPYMQHVISITCFGIQKKLPDEVLLALLLKSIAQRHRTDSGLTQDDLHFLLYDLGNPAVDALLKELSGLSDYAHGRGMEKWEKVATWSKRNEEKYSYLRGLSPAALLIELLSKYENLISDIKDLRIGGNKHWKFFHAKSGGDVIKYFKECLLIFQSLVEPYPFTASILKDFALQIDALRTLNKKQTRKKTETPVLEA